MIIPILLFTLDLFLGFSPSTVTADQPSPPLIIPASPQQPLILATRIIPPFVMRDGQGQWSGITIELWTTIAKELGIPFEIKETNLSGMLAGVQSGEFDVAAAAITINAERERVMDFSHPFYNTGFAIAVPTQKKPWWKRLGEAILSPAFLGPMGGLFFIIFIAGTAIWLVERRVNPLFEAQPKMGLISGFWWAVVTMSTVGYGDKYPVTLKGKFISVIWMFTSIITISTLTATLTTAFTYDDIYGRVRSAEDLHQFKIGVLPHSTAEKYLHERHITTKSYPSLEEALADVADQKIQAILYDAPLLTFLIKNDPDLSGHVTLLPQILDRQEYGFALKRDSPLRKAINQVMLEKLRTQEWRDILFRYLGER